MTDTDEHVDVEQLMQQIRRQILEKRAASGDNAAAHVPVGGQRLPPDFYDHLYLAGLAYNQLQVDELIQESRLPVIGPLLNRFRQALHRLVIFYVNRVAERQQIMNMHLLRGLSILSDEFERDQEE
jgi:hypothetical protein